MKTLSKALVGTVAAGAMAVSAASPAAAQYRDYRNHDNGISAGEVIAGALIIGGIAAAVSSGNNDRYGRNYQYERSGYPNGGYDNGRYSNGYNYGGNPRQAVEQCVYAAERQAQRYGRADVTDIRDVRQTRYGFEVRGRIAVRGNNNGWDRGDRQYGNGWNNGDNRYGNDRNNGDNRYGSGWNNGDSRYGSGWNNDYRGWNENLRGYDSGSFKCQFAQGRVYGIDFNGIRGL